MYRFVICVSLWLAFWNCPCAFAQEFRMWSDPTGKFNVEAKLIELDEKKGIVTIERPDGKTAKVKIEKLSSADQDYCRDYLAKQKDDAAISDAPNDNNVSQDDDSRDFSSSAATPKMKPRPGVINAVRSTVLQRQASNNLRQIAYALVQYEATNQRFPPAALTAANGKPGLSWRVAILPMLDENALYRQFRLNEPWDSDHNKALVDRMPSIFEPVGGDAEPGYTQILAVVGKGLAFEPDEQRGLRIREIQDGTSKTIAVVEADDTYAVPWTKPAEYYLPPDNPLIGLGNIWNNGFLAGYFDAHVSPVPVMDAKSIMPAFTRRGSDLHSIP